MPNWCLNKLTLTGPEAEVQAFRERAVGHSPWLRPEEVRQEPPAVLNFHSLVPIPAEILTRPYEEAGYDWERENWGCKWGASDPRIVDAWEGHVEYEFATAWSPPEKLLEKVAVQAPALKLILEYEEPGNGFKGIAKFQGAVHEDHCISL